jgi:hypothetical protein
VRTENPGQDLGFAIPLVRNGEPFLPDNGQVSWSLRGQDGSVIVGPTQVTGVTDTQVQLTVVAADNTVAGGLLFEKRTILVTGAVGGQPFSIRVIYRLTAWLNYTASADDVRAFMGIDLAELPDSDIDLTIAYSDVAGVVSKDLLDSALVAGDATEIAANRAIVARAVINVIPSAQARMLKSQSDGTQDIDRFKVDFDGLRQDAIDSLARNIDGILPTTSIIDFKASATSSNIDPVTNA